MHKMTGVYRIRNKANGKVYIGSSAKGFKKRWDKHLSDLRKGTHHSVALQHAWNKYGEDGFAFEIVELCDPNECVAAEQRELDRVRSFIPKHGYNIRKTADSFLGMKHRDETKRKISKANKGVPKSEQTRQKLSEAKQNCSDETRRRLSVAQSGKKLSEETKRKMSLTRSTPEARQANSDRVRRKAEDPAYRAKLSEAQKRAQTPEVLEGKRLVRLRMIENDPDYSRKMSDIAKAAADSPGGRQRLSEQAVKQFSDPSARKAISDMQKQKWADPAYREKMRAAFANRKKRNQPVVETAGHE